VVSVQPVGHERDLVDAGGVLEVVLAVRLQLVAHRRFYAPESLLPALFWFQDGNRARCKEANEEQKQTHFDGTKEYLYVFFATRVSAFIVSARFLFLTAFIVSERFLFLITAT
tara:strand:+ start:255 stop:593 length:339 start_codon:yes stop_codon:yes gene_type:complete